MTTRSEGKIYSLSVGIDELIKTTPFPDGYIGLFTNDDGLMDPEAALAHLTIEKARGRRLIPVSAECGNPCQHQSNGCTGFDHIKSGCPGRNRTA